MPVLGRPTSSNHANTALDDLSHFLTPRRFRRGERRVASAIDYADVHRSIAQRMYEYLARPRRNYYRPLTGWYGDLAPCFSHQLRAPNMEARIAFTETAIAVLRKHREFYAEPLFFVSVCPRKYVYPLERASQADLRGLQQTTRQALAGLSFIAMTDFALFKCWGTKQIAGLHDHVGVHTHAIVFGATREQIDAALDAMGADFRDLAYRRAGHCMRITARQLEGYLRYALKAPLSHYHAQTGMRRWKNAETGEWEQAPKLDPHPLRTGDQLRMSAITHQMRLDELLFGQHAGTALVREIRELARGPLRAAIAKERMQRRGSRERISEACTLKPRERALLSALIAPNLNPLISRYRKKAAAPKAKIVGMDDASVKALIDELNQI